MPLAQQARRRALGPAQQRARWDAQFRRISGPRPGFSQTASFGTIAGLYTSGEVADLIAAKDKEISVLKKAASDVVMTAWALTDPSAAGSWKNDFTLLQHDYEAAKKSAGIQDTVYKAILTALNPNWQQHDASTDRLLDLNRRLAAAGHPVAPYTVPQPMHPDFDRHPLQGAKDIASQAWDETVKDADVLWQDTKDVAQKITTWSRPVLIAIAAIAALLGFTLIRVYLPAPQPRQLPPST